MNAINLVVIFADNVLHVIIMEMIGFIVFRYKDESKNQFSYRITCQQQLTPAK